MNYLVKLAVDPYPLQLGMSILWAALIMFGVALLLGILIVVLGKVFAVPEDPRIGEINAKLAGANCGACGFAGCGGYATALVEGTAEPNKCGGADNAAIAKILGVEATAGEKTYATIACNGGNAAKDKYSYQGYADCLSNNNAFGGRKSCETGCLGYGTCNSVCPANAIEIGPDGYAVVDKAKCISCGKCITNCPKGIIKKLPESAQVRVACSAKCAGKEVRNVCEKGCIKCGICVKNCAAGAIKLEGNPVPVIDYSKCGGCGLCVDKCPRKVIKKI